MALTGGFYDSETYRSDLESAAKNTLGLEQIKGKRVMITGATGTIGQFLVDLLLHYNQTDSAETYIYAVSRDKGRLEKRFGGVRSRYLTLVAQDLLAPIQFNISVDYIIHAAGNAYPAAFTKDPVGTMMGLVSGTFALLEYGRAQKIQRFLYLSSGEVYGQGDVTLDAFSEEYGGYVDPLSPRSCYPMGKRAAETLCASFCKQYGLETVIVRPCHTYGPGMTAWDNRAHVQFLRNALRGEDIILNSAGQQRRSYSYVADCASIIFSVLLRGTSGEAYNSANAHAQTTIRGLAEIIARYAGTKVRFSLPKEDASAEQTPIAKQVLNCEKMEALGWKGQYSIERGIAHTLKVLKEATGESGPYYGFHFRAK